MSGAAARGKLPAMSRPTWISVTPELAVGDVREAQEWYRDALDWRIGWTAPDGSYGALYVETLELFLKRSDGAPGGAVCCLRVSDVEAVYEACLEAGAASVSPLEQKPWAMREFSLEDPYGNTLRIGQSTLGEGSG